MKYLNRALLLFFLASSLFSCGNKNDKKETDKEAQVEADTSTTQKTEAEELSNSPRHHQWVTLSQGNREFQAFVAYPETNEATKSVIVIHENRGLNDWARLFADKLAEAGYLVIAPDLISNTQDGKRRTTDFENPDTAREAIYALDPEQVTADLDAAFKYIQEDSASTGEVAVVGFCWGGSQTFRYATNNQEISAAHVFYGTGPEDAEGIAKISAPVYGYYGGEDNRVNSTIEASEKLMEKAGKTYDYEIYKGAGHAFMRSGHQTDANKANKEAHDKAWKRLKELL